MAHLMLSATLWGGLVVLLCGVMAYLMLSATLVARLVELLTKFGGVISEAEGMIIEEDFAVQWAFV